MTDWVSQAEARRLLEADGDKVTQPALSYYLANHPEIDRRSRGPGLRMEIDFAALKRSRATRNSRGPASQPSLSLAASASAVAELLEPQANGGALLRRERSPDELSERKAKADTEAAEFNARYAKIRAEEAEGRLISRETAAASFIAAGVALLRSLQENRRSAIEEIRAAPDVRGADLAMKAYERRLRAALASELTKFAGLAGLVEPAAAQDGL